MMIPSVVLGMVLREKKGKICKIVAYGCFDSVCTAPLGPIVVNSKVERRHGNHMIVTDKIMLDRIVPK